MIQSQKCNASHLTDIRWTKWQASVSKCNVQEALLVNSWGYYSHNAQQ